MDKIRTIVIKEWAEVFRNRLVLLSVVFVPLLLVALPLVVITITNNVGMDEAALEQELAEVPGAALEQLCRGLSAGDCLQAYMLNIFTLLFMIIPVMVPVTIAAYSVVGEKTTRSLEPLLATPITTLQLLLGKALAAVGPAVAATWLAYGLYLLVARFTVSPTIFGMAVSPLWLLAIGVVSPLLSWLSVIFALMISSRVTDPRVAEQLAGMVVLPIVLVLVGQALGLILINQQIILVVGLVVAVLDGVLTYFAVSLFERENILTRWK